MQKPGAQIDSRIEVVTPENIAFQYRVAGPFRRMPAYSIDILIRIGILLIARWAILMLGFAGGGAMLGFGFGALMVIWFVLEWFYGGIFETFWNGQTPGKWACGIRVVATDGQPIDALQAVMRNILRAADALPVLTLPIAGEMRDVFLYQVGLWVPAFNDRYQRLGDLASGTMVVIDERPALYGVVRITEPEAIRLAELIPHNFVVNRSLAHTLSLYVDRRRGLSGTRRVEIARPLAEPLRIMFGLPTQINADLLLAAVYYRAFYAPAAAATNAARGTAAVSTESEPPTVPSWALPPSNLATTADQLTELENYLDRIG